MEEIDIKDLFLIFWNRKAEMFLIILITMLIGVIYSYFLVVPEYKASTKLVLAQSTTGKRDTTEQAITQADVSLNSQLVSTYSEIIKSKTILREVINSMNIEYLEEADLKKKISVKAVNETEVIEITVKDIDPNIAAEIANKIAEVFSEKVVDIYKISNIYILDKAEPSSKPSNTNHVKDIVIFGFVGTVISFGVVLIINMLDTTIKTEEDVENITGLIVLSSIPNYDVELKQKKKERRRG